MSNVVFELFAKLGLDSTEYSNGLTNAKTEATSFGGVIGKGLKTAVSIGVKALAAGTAAVTAFGVSSIKVGAEFDKSMSQVAATMGLSMDELKTQVGSVDTAFGEFTGNLREYAQYMGKNTAFSASEAADALNYMALAGYDVQESMTMLPNVLNLAAAGNMDLATASDMVTDAQTAFGLEMSEMPQLIDEMAKASSTGNTSVSQLGEAFLTVGGLAQELNGGFITLADGTEASVSGIQEMEIALTAMANAGVKGSEAGTHMRNMLLKLSDPTDEGTTALERMGVAVFDTAGNMRSLSDIFGDLNTKLSDMTQEKKIQTISALFNTRDLASAEALLNAVGQDWDEIGASILDSKDAAQKMADTQLDNLAGDVTKLKSAFEGVQIAVSDQNTGMLRNFVQLVTRGVSDLGIAFSTFDASPYLDEMGRMTQEGAMAQAEFQKNRKAAIEDMFATITDGVGMIVDVIPDLIKGGAQIIKALAKGIMDNADKILEAGITLIQDLGQSIADNSAEIEAVGITILDMLLNAITVGIPQLLSDFAQFFANSFPTVIDRLTDVMLQLALAFSDPNMISSLIQSAVSIITTLAQSLLDNLPKFIETAPKIIQGFIQGLVQALPSLIEGAIQILGSLAQFIIENLPLIVASAFEIIFALANGLIEAMPSLIVAGYQLVTELLNVLIASFPKFLDNGLKIVKSIITGIVNMYGAVIQSGIDLITKFIQSIKDRYTSLVETGKQVIETVKNGIQQKIEDAKQWGQDLIENFINGIKEKWEALKSTVSDVAASIKAFLGFSEPEKGPLSNFHTYAPDMMDLFMQGIEDNKAKLLDTVADAFNFRDIIVSPSASVETAGASGFNQTVNIYSPEELSPSEVARQTKNATRDMLLELRGL